MNRVWVSSGVAPLKTVLTSNTIGGLVEGAAKAEVAKRAAAVASAKTFILYWAGKIDSVLKRSKYKNVGELYESR